MEEQKWPVDICESCGFNLREKTPKAAEKANDAKGILKWTDFCPKCGVGMFVGDRFLTAPTAEELASRDAAPALAFTEAKPTEDKSEAKPTPEPSGVPPDKRGAALAEENPDPEGLINQETQPQAEAKPEPGAIKPPGKGEFFCTKCASNHKETSKIGKRHTKNREA